MGGIDGSGSHPGAVWAIRERFFPTFRVARIAVSASLESTSPHTQNRLLGLKFIKVLAFFK